MGKYGYYLINCECGLAYVGETKRAIKTRIGEHQRETGKQKEKYNSAIAEHYSETKHNIDWNGSKVLHVEPYYSRRKIKEAIEIRKHPNNLNRDDAYPLSRTWKYLLKTLDNSRTSPQVSPPTPSLPAVPEESPKPHNSQRTREFLPRKCKV